MMQHVRRCLAISALAGLSWTATAGAEAPDPADWPFPQDIPQPAQAAPGLAGDLPVDIVRFLLTRGAGSPQLSPDGESVVFTSNVTGLAQLWLVSARGGWPRQLTFGPAVTLHRWLPDGSGLMYAADRQGDEREAYWFLSADGTRERPILDFDGAFRVFGSFDDDGSRLVYSSTLRNGIDFDIHVADVATGESRLVHEGRFGYLADAWQPGGSLVLVRETRGEDGNDLHLLDIDSGELQTLFAPPEHAYFGDFAWRPDGSGFYLITNYEREFQAVAHYSLASGELEILEQVEGQDIDGLALSPDGRDLVWTVNDGGWSRLEGRDLSTGRPLAVPELPRGVYSIGFAGASSVLSISVSGPDEPGAVWTWNLETEQLAEAAPSELAGIPREILVSPETVSFRARDDVELHGLLYLPTPAGENPPPLLMLVHGGPTAQARPDFSAVTQYLVGRGIAVLDFNFRGSTGYGKTFTRLDNQRLRPDAVRDLIDALDFLRADGRVNADRAAVMGGSYGGYLVNDVLGRYPEAFAAGVSFVGVSDWVRALEEASPALQASDRIEYGDIHDVQMREFFRELSPLTRVDRIIAPMLFQHGANDPRDPVGESDRMVLALRERGLEVEYLRHPDEGHSVRRLENRIDMYRRVAAFLEKHLVDGPDSGGPAAAD
jgi:dipeptidyl aminopeptidase/acylaminoacyl peptidase